MGRNESSHQDDQAAYNRLRWHSRRGMLELDLLLEPFVTAVYPQLDQRLQERYRKLLDCEDQVLFNWLMRKSEEGIEPHREIIELIWHHKLSTGS